MTNKEEKVRLTESGVITEPALLAYLHEQLSPEDRQEMERLLKDDPFAQEALEGLKSAQDKTAMADSLQNIRRKVHKHMNKKEKSLLHIHWTNYAWAAAILGLLISIGTILIVYIGKKNDHGELAKQESTNMPEPKKEEPTIIPAPVTANDSTAMQQTTAAATSEPITEKKENKSIAPVATGNANKDTVTKAPQGYIKNAEVTKQKTDKNVVADISNKENAKVSNFTATKKSVAVPAASANYNYSANNTNPGKTNTIAAKDTTTGQSPAAQAMKTFYTGDYKAAEQQFDDVLKQQPQDPEALFFGGISNYVNGNLEKSEKNFDQLLKQHKKFTDGSKWYKANILLKQGKKEEAKKLLQELSETGGSYKERAQKKLTETQF